MRLEDVWLRYSPRRPWILREVTVSLLPGEVAVVLGRNGVGKSTLLSAIAGVLPVGRGTVQSRPSIVGWAPEHFPNNQVISVSGYLMSLARIRKVPEPASTVEKWASRLHLTPFLHTRLTELSKGSAQKVALAQAILAPPGLLVLDEPWEGLDAETLSEVPKIIGEVLESGGSVLVSDHRGDAVNLNGAVRWEVADGTVTVQS